MGGAFTILLAGLLVIGSALTPSAATAPPPRTFLPLVTRAFFATSPPLKVSALYYDPYLSGEPDEAFQIYNPLAESVSLVGWQITDGRRAAIFPVEISLAPLSKLWCAQQAASFQVSFGRKPECEYGIDSDPNVPNLTGGTLRFANTGGQVTLRDPGGASRDVLVYEGGDTEMVGWLGEAVYPFRPSQNFGQEGQILYRKLDQLTGLPVADTNTRADWAQDPQDLLDGRKAQYPGWALEQFFMPRTITEQAHLGILVSPDHAFTAMYSILAGAQHSIRFEGYTLENARLGEAIAARARAGVDVEILLEGGPPGGVSDQQRWIVQQIAEAGGRVYYMRSDASADINDRYAYQHGKFWVIDGTLALVGSENPNAGAFPDDDKSDGTFGRRGVCLTIDAPSVIADLTAVMDADIAPGVHRDVWKWNSSDPTLGAPPPEFKPAYESGGIFYPIQKPTPLSLTGTFTLQLIHSPEQSLRDQDSLLGLVAQAGLGDTLLVEQLYEHTYWGATDSNVTNDPNPRLQAYIAAARRGARVRVLLDAYFDNRDLNSPRSNLRTVEYLKAIAQAESLDLDARRRNPTGEGIHNKMVLGEIDGQGWVIVGSLNGGEVSAKLNREMALKAQSDAAYAYLADLFWYDWAVEP